MNPAEFDADEYSRSTKELADYGELLKSLIGALLSANGIKTHSIVYRVKQRESAYKKIRSNPRKYNDYRSLTDLLGIRIISYFSDEVDDIAKILEREFAVDAANSVDKRAILAPNTFGYMSVHYILTMSKERCKFAEYARFSSIAFEVQVRSVLQHAWAEIEHDLGYKAAGEIPSQFRRVFSRIAGTLEGADEEFVRMRESLRTYEGDIQQSMSRSFAGIELNANTVKQFVKQSETVQRIDLKVASHTGVKLRPGYDKEALRMALRLPVVGIETIDQIEQALLDNETELPVFAGRFIGHENVTSSKPMVGGGVSLDYLCYYLIARIPDDEERRAAIASVFDMLTEPRLLDAILGDALGE